MQAHDLPCCLSILSAAAARMHARMPKGYVWRSVHSCRLPKHIASLSISAKVIMACRHCTHAIKPEAHQLAADMAIRQSMAQHDPVLHTQACLHSDVSHLHSYCQRQPKSFLAASSTTSTTRLRKLLSWISGDSSRSYIVAAAQYRLTRLL